MLKEGADYRCVGSERVGDERVEDEERSGDMWK